LTFRIAADRLPDFTSGVFPIDDYSNAETVVGF